MKRKLIIPASNSTLMDYLNEKSKESFGVAWIRTGFLPLLDLDDVDVYYNYMYSQGLTSVDKVIADVVLLWNLYCVIEDNVWFLRNLRKKKANKIVKIMIENTSSEFFHSTKNNMHLKFEEEKIFNITMSVALEFIRRHRDLRVIDDSYRSIIKNLILEKRSIYASF